MSRIFILLALALLPLTGSAQRGTTADDLAHREPSIHWPAAFDPASARIFSHNELLMHATCEHAFARLTDVTSWPGWFPLVKNVTVVGPAKVVRHGTLLHLRIFGSPISARIDEFVPGARLSWIPKGDTERTPGHYHTWRFFPEAGTCRVITEESGITAEDARQAALGNTLMHRAHDLWLAGLRFTAEQ